MTELQTFLHNNFGQMLFVIVGALVFVTLISASHRLLKSKLLNTKYLWDKALLAAVYPPAQVYILTSAAFMLLKLTPIVTKLNIKSVNFSDIQNVLFLVILIWAIFRMVNRLERAALTEKKVPGKTQANPATIRVLVQFVRFAIVIIAAISLLQILGIPVTGLLTFGGIGGVVLGFAAKDSLANLLGGMMIFIDRPFMVGDWILSPDRDIEGTVEHIGWRLTRIRTFDKRSLYIPNGIFSSIVVENATRMTNRRIKTTIGLRYDDAAKLPKVLELIKDMLKNHPEIDTSKTMLVNFVGFGDSTLDILIYTFTKTTLWAPYKDVQEDVFLKILAIIEQEGASCAFPTRTLYMANQGQTQT